MLLENISLKQYKIKKIIKNFSQSINKLLKDIAGKFGLMCKKLQKLNIADKSEWKKDYQFIRKKGDMIINGFNFKKESKKLPELTLKEFADLF